MSILKKKIEAKNKLVNKETKKSSLIKNVWLLLDQPNMFNWMDIKKIIEKPINSIIWFEKLAKNKIRLK